MQNRLRIGKGDFNINKYLPENTISSDAKTNLLLQFLNFTQLQQLNFVPNFHKRYLDLVVSNLKCVVSKAEYTFLTEDLHHPALNLYVDTSDISSKHFVSTNVNNGYKFFNFRRANLSLLFDELKKTDWSFLDSCCDVDDACELFYNKFPKLITKPKWKFI